MKCTLNRIRTAFLAIALILLPLDLQAQEADDADITMTLYRNVVSYLDTWSPWHYAWQVSQPPKNKMLSLYEKDALSILITDPDTKQPSNRYLGYNRVKFYKPNTALDTPTRPYGVTLQQGTYLINDNGVIKQSQSDVIVKDEKALEHKVRKQIGNVMDASG